MYWYKLSALVVVIALMAAGCKPEVKDDKGQLKYFDIKKYFNAEAIRLAKQYPHITKTVSYNGQQETKTVTIKHWQQEFNSFIESDINKAAWKDSYSTNTNGSCITYTATDTTLHTRNLIINLKGNKVASVYVINFTKNMLYQTREALAYIPDSIYIIEKNQKVRLLGNNDYKITGKFKK
jgi:hypothetical protein